MLRHFHAVVFATCLVATVAVSLASAMTFIQPTGVAPKSDRLNTEGSEVSVKYLTIEKRKDGVSVLSRIPLGDKAS